MTLNAVCLSGLEAVAAAASLIACGDVEVAVAIGMESMSLAPRIWPGSRAGSQYGAIELIDTLEHDGLTDAFEGRSMGASTEEGNAALGIDRESQDAWSAESHRRAAASAEIHAGEIASLTIDSRPWPILVADDDGVRPDTNSDSLARLRPAFREGGTITAGNSSQISDGAAALVLMSERAAAAAGTRPLAEIAAYAVVAGPDVRSHAQPAHAIRRALARLSASPESLAVAEINEAFAAVAVHSTRELGVDPAIVNPHGGAIALGHPIGASGARIVGTLARNLAEQGPGALGAAGICGGGGQGSAIVLRSL